MHAVAVTTNSDLLSAFFIQLIVSVAPIVADVGLWFVKSPEPFVTPLKEDVLFDCSLNVPAEVIRWRHGRKYLPQNRTALSRASATQLIIKVENESQLGDYQCVAWIGASALASVPAKLTLAEIKPFPHQPEIRYQVTAGNMVSIFCPPPVSNPAALIQYYHNDRKLSPSNVRILPTSNSLLLINVSSQDSGVYTCSATNYINDKTLHSSFRVILTVVPNNSVMPSPPKFLAVPQNNYVVQNGTNVTIECVAVGEPPPRLKWYKEDLQALPNSRTEFLPGSLHLKNIVPEDAGEYVCEVDNGISPIQRHKVLLHVHEAPRVLREPNITLVEEQGDTELSCEVAGNPIPTITWTLNGDPLENDAHVHVSNSRIALRMIQKRHAGIYQCFATNSVGTVYGSVMLQVSPKQITDNDNPSRIIYDQNGWSENGKNGRAGSNNHNHSHNHGKKEHTRKDKQKRKHKENDIMVPPARPNVTRLSDRSVMVRWHVPPNSGLQILFFKVQYREVGMNETGKGSRWMTSNEDIPPHIRSYEINRLEPNRYYKFRVAAVYSNNDNKLSLNSNKFFLRQGSPAERSRPSPPTLFSADAVSPNSIQIEWNYMNSVLIPVDGFYIYYRATNNAGEYVKATVEGEKIRSFVITHLQPDTSYDIKIQSFTVGAASNFSAIVTRKTLVDPLMSTKEVTRNDLKSPSVTVLSAVSSNTVQLLIIFGGVIVALVILFMVFVVICYLKQRALGDSSSEDENIPDKNTNNIMRIHQVEPVATNGYINHSNHNNHNNKMMNGNVVKSCARNGYIAPHSHINITNNPLATESKHEKNMMEMSYLSKYNNNYTIDRCVDSENDCSRDVTTWKVREPEKYV